MHLRRTANRGFITEHDLADKRGNPPTDGQHAKMEMHHNSLDELLAAVKQHMGQDPNADPDDEQAPGE